MTLRCHDLANPSILFELFRFTTKLFLFIILCCFFVFLPHCFSCLAAKAVAREVLEALDLLLSIAGPVVGESINFSYTRPPLFICLFFLSVSAPALCRFFLHFLAKEALFLSEMGGIGGYGRIARHGMAWVTHLLKGDEVHPVGGFTKGNDGHETSWLELFFLTMDHRMHARTRT